MLNSTLHGTALQNAEIAIARYCLKLKEITGITTSDFIRNVRLKQAAKLLVENILSHFKRLGKRTMPITPFLKRDVIDVA